MFTKKFWKFYGNNLRDISYVGIKLGLLLIFMIIFQIACGNSWAFAIGYILIDPFSYYLIIYPSDLKRESMEDFPETLEENLESLEEIDMKILKEGKLPIKEPTFYRGECIKCGCQIEVEKKEIKNSPIVLCPTIGCCSFIKVKEYITRDIGKKIMLGYD